MEGVVRRRYKEASERNRGLVYTLNNTSSHMLKEEN